MTATTPFVEAREVEKRFGSVRALNGASLRVPTGRIEGLVGHNGAGKSTLISVICGAQRADDGEIALAGSPFDGGGVVEAERHGVILVPQRTALFEELSVLDNLMIPRRYPVKAGALVSRGQARRLAQASLAEVGLDGTSLGARVRTLSVAEQRSLMIARALLREPRLLILDEPTEAFAEAEVERLFEVLRGMVDRGMTVLYVSHRLDEVVELCDHVTVLRDGATVAELEAEQVDRRKLIQTMLGEETAVAAESAVPADVRAQPAEVLALRSVATDRLAGASLSVGAGEVVGLYGLVGSGSTDVLKALAGLQTVTDGEIVFDGEPLVGSVADRRLRGLSYLSDAIPTEAALTGLSVRENVSIGVSGGIRRWKRLPVVSGRQEAELATSALRRVGLDEGRIGATIEALSGGMQQKAMLARSIVNDSRVWLLDEPLTGLDVHSRIEISNLVRELVAEPSTRGPRCAILVLSDFEDLRVSCDRVYTVRDGRITDEFKAGEFTEHDLVHAVSFHPVV